MAWSRPTRTNSPGPRTSTASCAPIRLCRTRWRWRLAAARATCPVFLGYVGKGMLDGCAVGDVFASPTADQMLAVTKRIHGGKGVVYIYGNYGGDVMNFDMAAEMADIRRHRRAHRVGQGRRGLGAAG